MSEFNQEDLLVSPERAKEQIIARIEALANCGEDGNALMAWHDDTSDVLDAIYVSGARSYFQKNSGFVFGYFVNRPKELRKVNRDRAIGILQRLVDHLPTQSESQINVSSDQHEETTVTNEIFVVHGHDRAGLSEVARSLEKLKLRPIILQEQPNRGATIIEKFEANAEVGFAVVLMTSDDLGGVNKGDISKTEFQSRARQNVVLELGYFIGALGRKNVCVLKADEVETPSDIFGVVYTPFDATGRWKFDLVRELKAAGYSVSADDIL